MAAHHGLRGWMRIVGAGAAALALLPLSAAKADERSDREEVRRQQAAVASQLDALRASDAELLGAVQTLDEHVRAQQAKVSEAQAAASRADDDAARVRTDIARTEGEVADLERQLQGRAVAAYVNPQGRFDTSQIVLTSDDFGESERQKVLAESVTGNDQDLVDQLRGAREQLGVQRDEADRLSAEAAARRAESEDRLRELQSAKADQERLRQALQSRIADAQAESSGLAAADARLSALIQARDDEARRQAAAQAEEERRRNAPPSTVPAPGGSAPGTTARPGGGTPGTPTSTGPTTTVSRPASATGLIWPVAGSVSSEFGPRWGSFHPGIDIWAPMGTPVVAAKGGTVISVGVVDGYGNLVVIDHGGGFATAYAHLSAFTVSAGQTVGQGQQVGNVGCTGSCTGPHLHFETRVNGAVQNPRNYLP